MFDELIVKIDAKNYVVRSTNGSTSTDKGEAILLRIQWGKTITIHSKQSSSQLNRRRQLDCETLN